MKPLLFVFFILTIITSESITAQEFNYSFIPKHLKLLSDEEASAAQIMITSSVMLYAEDGILLPMSQMQLMANPDYKPLFYTDSYDKVKAVVFQKRSNHTISIEKNPEANYKKGEKAYDFIAEDINGNAVKLSELKGKVVVLNFWFTKCPPCIQEMPQLNELVNEFSNKNVEFLALTFDKNPVINSFLIKNNFNYKILPNANYVITMYGVQTYPTSIIINQKGEIMYKELGFQLNIKDVLSKEINALL